MSLRSRVGSLVALVLGAGLLAPGTAGAAERPVVDLGVLPGGTTSSPHAVNESCTVVGTSTDASGAYRAVRWDRDGKITLLPGLVETGSDRAVAVNERGVAAGTVATDNNQFDRAVRWGVDGRATYLAALPGHRGSTAVGIDADGAVLGWSYDSQGPRIPVRWGPDGRITRLATLGGDAFARGALPDGRVFGEAWTPDGTSRPVVWDRRGRITDLTPSGTGWISHATPLGVLVGSADGRGAYWDRSGRRTDLTPNAQVVGVTRDGVASTNVPAWTTRAVRQAGGVLTELPLLPDGEYTRSLTYDVNSDGTDVGETAVQAVTWDPAGAVHALPVPAGVRISRAVRITEGGAVVGEGHDVPSLSHALLWPQNCRRD